MRVGVLTTSWPSVARPWAGHFVADHASMIAKHCGLVSVVAPAWTADGGLLAKPEVDLHACTVSGRGGSLVGEPTRGLRAISALGQVARRLERDLWICHWWPTLAAAPARAPVLAVLHGSDVDLLERAPRAVARWVASRGLVAAVAPHLADRFVRRTHRRYGDGALESVRRPLVCPLGARRGSCDAPVPPQAREWARYDGHRVLTVARADPAKGLARARAAGLLLPGVNWLVAGGHPSLSPEAVRNLIARSHVVVVPSLDGPGMPKEGRPHIITQALVAGRPLVGGPNATVRTWLESLGQMGADARGPKALAAAVTRALEQRRFLEMSARAASAGESLTWEAVASRWLNALSQAAS